MNGIICVDKASDMTSFDVIAKLRGILKMRKLGHGGTLDPLATGVLPVFIGKAAKAVDLLDAEIKEYVAGFMLGIKTDTLDITGNTLETARVAVAKDALLSAFDDFRGEIEQIPPMYSAISVGGQRLYKLARMGIEVERPARRVTIFQLELLSYDPELRCGEIKVRCSRGTYIRTLIDDVGTKLKCGAVMTSLRRTLSSGFSIDDAHTLDEIVQYAKTQQLSSLIIPIEKAFEHLPDIRLDEVQEALYKNGQVLDLSRVPHDDTKTLHRVFGGDFIGICETNEETGELKVYKNLT